MSPRSPLDPGTTYGVFTSRTPVSEDGYKIGEPKYLYCDDCWAYVQLTEFPSAGIDDLPHHHSCEQRFAKTETWYEQAED